MKTENTMQEEFEKGLDRIYIMEKAGKPGVHVVHTKLIRDIPVKEHAIQTLYEIQKKQGYLTDQDVYLQPVNSRDDCGELIASLWSDAEEEFALGNSQYRLEDKEKPSSSFGAWVKHFTRPWLEDNDKAMEEQYQLTWDEISNDFAENYQVAKFVEFLKQNYEPPKKKIT